MKNILSACLLTLSKKFIFPFTVRNNYIFNKMKLWNRGKKNHHFENPLTIFYKLRLIKWLIFSVVNLHSAFSLCHEDVLIQAVISTIARL